MSDFILIFLGIFILILIILIFTLLAYVYTTYVSYTIEINKNLDESEDAINKTNKAFNTLQDSVVNNIAIVKTNQEKILNDNNIKDQLNTLDSNLFKIIKIKNNNSNISSIISSNLDTANPIEVDFTSIISSYKNINAITTSNQYFNICNNESDATKRKCVNMNIDNDGVFNIHSKNNLSNNGKSNIANIAIKDYDDNILASFNGDNKSISLGSNINPAISINNNIYTPDIIVCNYNYTPEISETPPKITISYISNFKISKDVFINFIIMDNVMQTMSNNQPGTIQNLENYSYNSTSKILKIKSSIDIPINTIKIFSIPFTKVSEPRITVPESSFKFNTNGYITNA
jgi:hypothetical protein